ncbi:MAG TPA: MFS transporter, partial [Gaiellaceae bacterium]|nr:MFS transporter [Gaiellaceae bacterium]
MTGAGKSRYGASAALALGFVAMFSSGPGQSFVIAVFLDDMLAGTGVSRTAFSALYGVATIASATMSFWLGRGADRFGLRLAWILVAAGLAAACFLASVAGGVLSVLIALSLLRAFGQGSFPLLATLIVNYWFPRRPGAAMSVARAGVPAATILLPPLLALLIDGVGWQAAYRILAGVVLGLVLPLGLLLRTPPSRGAVETTTLPGPEVPTLAASRRSRRLGIKIPRREAALLLFVSAAPPLVMTALTFHVVSLLGGRGLPAPAAAAALSVFGAASAIATLALGPFSDRLSTRSLLVATNAVLLLGVSLLFMS